MSFTSNIRSSKEKLRKTRRFSLSIGLRLFLAFLVIILLTGLIGALAIQRFSSLTNTTTELNSHDLPEVITLVHLRSLLYRQRDLERNFLFGANTNQPQLDTPELTPTVIAPGEQGKQDQQTLSDLAAVLKEIAGERQKLLAFEHSVQGSIVNDLPLVQRVADGVLKTSALSERLQALFLQGQGAQARSLDIGQMEPQRTATISNVTQLIAIEQAETSNDAAQAYQDSGRASLFVLVLTALCLLLSIVLAVGITRALTRPLKALVQTSEAIASGDLDAEAQVERGDEIGRLAAAYDRMRLSLRSTIASLHQEREQTQAIIDTSADGIIVVDEAQRIVKCNPAAEHLSGWRADEAIGRYCWEILGFKETSVSAARANNSLSPLIEALLTRLEQSNLEMPIITRNGKQRWLAISCAPMPFDVADGEQYTVIGLHDISQLKAVDQMKSDFVAIVSHELRAPLTTVAGSVETLGLLDPASDRETYHEVINMLDQQTRRLRQVVEEVLQLTRFEAGRLEAHLQSLPIQGFLRSLVGKVNTEWSDSDHNIIYHASPVEILAWADAGFLEIVLRNLFENARKYTPAGMPVEVAARIDAANRQVEIRVIDHGPGIPEDQLEHIFERFSRGTQSFDNWTRGYGLGLYIARELMLAHNGSIRVENREQGACFVLSLWTLINDPHSTTGEAEDVEAPEGGYVR